MGNNNLINEFMHFATSALGLSVEPPFIDLALKIRDAYMASKDMEIHMLLNDTSPDVSQTVKAEGERIGCVFDLRNRSQKSAVSLNVPYKDVKKYWEDIDPDQCLDCFTVRFIDGACNYVYLPLNHLGMHNRACFHKHADCFLVKKEEPVHSFPAFDYNIEPRLLVKPAEKPVEAQSRDATVRFLVSRMLNSKKNFHVALSMAYGGDWSALSYNNTHINYNPVNSLIAGTASEKIEDCKKASEKLTQVADALSKAKDLFDAAGGLVGLTEDLTEKIIKELPLKAVSFADEESKDVLDLVHYVLRGEPDE